jgi:Undecaprenyl-phosphate galactose phosphotransferase WbaP
MMNYSSKKKRKWAHDLFLIDILIFISSYIFGFLISLWVNYNESLDNYLSTLRVENLLLRSALYISVILICLYLLHQDDRYSTPKKAGECFYNSSHVILIALVVETFLQYTFKQSFSRSWLFSNWVIALVLLPVGYIYVKNKHLKLNQWNTRVILVGGDKYRNILKQFVVIENDALYKIVHEASLLSFGENDLKIASTLVELAKREDAHIIFTLPNIGIDKYVDIFREIDFHNASYSIALNLGEAGRRGMLSNMDIINGVAFIKEASSIFNPLQNTLKRMIDICLGILSCFVFLIPMIIIGSIISLSGPIFYRHERIGKDMKKIKIIKFRTMDIDADVKLNEYLKNNPAAQEEWDLNAKLKMDPRVSKFSQFIRSYSLDELPQLFNVLKGEMSLVGPRPVLEIDLDLYYKKEKSIYLSVKPGMTGLWQVSGRNNTTYERRIDLDSSYIRRWSLSLDIKIIFLTIFAVLQKDGAY